MDPLINLLHLEDDPVDAELVQVKLTQAGLACRIQVSQTRDEFETSLDQSGPDIILADFQLPEYDGMSALHLAKKLQPDIPFIFVSGKLGEETAIEALTQGATDYVLKHNLSRLPSAVRRALNEARNRRERRQAQEALQRSNEMLRAIIEAAPVAIIGLNLDGHVRSVWNPAAEKMLGWRAEEVMGRPLPSVPADRQDEFKSFREQIRRGLNLDGVEVCRQRRDGTPIDYSIYASPLYDAQERINGNIAVLVDISERKRAEAALRASEARYIDLYDNAPDMYVSVNAQTASIERCNQTLAETLGHPKEEIVGRPVFDLYHPGCQDRAKEAFQEFLQSGEVHDTELQLQKKDGTKLDVSLNTSAVRDEDGAIVFSRSTLRDITETRRNRMINAARMHLMQFAVTHPLDELLEETINAAENLTESLIGFYHFVDDDQQALTLQNWSTRTKDRFCIAQGKGLHYPVSEAGVWVDCVRQRRPVVHNDYPSLPHRKGMPEGHAEVVRELVVPVMRGDQIMAILGVGNKAADYTQKDVEAISLLADLVWEITERRLVEQQVALMGFAMDSIHELAFLVDENARIQYVNDEASRLSGYARDELLTLHPSVIDPCFSMEDWPGQWNDLKQHGTIAFEREFKTRDGRLFPVEINANYFEYEGRGYVLSLVRDITERKKVEGERLANLRFLGCLDKVNQAIQKADSLEQMMRDVLEVVLSVLDCERVYLLHPCDPAADTWTVPMECSKPECAGYVYTQQLEMPMTATMAEMLQILVDAEGPVRFGPGADHPLPPHVPDRFGFQSMLAMTLFPKVGRPWQLGIQECSSARAWTGEEEQLLQEAGRRLENGLTSMLAYRNLRESEAKYRRIVDRANEGIWVIGPDTTTTFANARMAEMLGCSVEEMMGRPMTDFMFAEDVPDLERKIEDRRQGKREDYERRFRRRDGRTVWTHVSGSPIFDAGHHFIGAFAMYTDITENKLAQIRLNEQLHFLQQLIDTIPLPIYYKDLEGVYLGCNTAFEAFIGLPRKKIVGKTVHEVVPKTRADQHHKADLELLRKPGVMSYEVSGIHKNGKRRDVIFHKATFIDATDGVAGTVGTLVDITERKQAERERLENLRFFESMDKVNRAIQGADDLEKMMKDLLNAVMAIFDCDRAFLKYPCDPESPTWTSPMEVGKPEYPGVRHQNLSIPMDPHVAQVQRILLAADGPVAFGPDAPHELPEVVSKQFNVQSALSMALYPKTGSPWHFGMHQCSFVRVWTMEEMRMFEAIGRRLADGLGSLLSSRDLRKNEEFLDNIVEHIPNMIFVKDAQALKFVRFNKAGEQLVGCPREELLGKTDHDLFPKEVADFFTTKDRQVLASRELVDIPEETIRTRNDDVRILHTKKIPLLGETGEPDYLLGISEDITERKQAEASIRKLTQAIEQSPVSIVITDVKGRIEFVNATFTRITGYTFPEALGQNPRILKSGETPAEAYHRLWQTISSGGVWQGEFHNRKKNGELFWEQATIAPIRDADDVITHYVAVKEDITERKRLEEQLQKSQKMEAIGQLAGGVAHDFNNMLGVIIGYAEMILEKNVLKEPEYGYLEEILAAGRRSSDITRQLLAFARKQTIVPKILDLNETVEGILKLLRRLIGEGIDLAWLPGAKLWPVRMDPSQIDQILANLCVNARDAIADIGKVTIETENVYFDDDYCAEHKGFSPGAYIMLAVSDNGSGMDKATLSKIFEPFFTTKSVGKGTGLGLATVYGIVKQNAGFINVYSEPGHGSIFKIYLPRHSMLESSGQKENGGYQNLGGHETILVVEDEDSNLKITKLILERYGYKVLAAATPDEALLKAGEHSDEIQLLLTDLIMPEMNGRELAEKIAALYPGISCLYMSGYTGEVIVHHGVLDEGIHFLQKPFSKEALAGKVREVLDSKKGNGR